MAQSDSSSQVPASIPDNASQSQGLWRRLMNIRRDKDNGSSSAFPPPVPDQSQGSEQDDTSRPGLIRRVSRKVVPGLPRAQTFKRQQSELRNKLEPVEQTPAERRAVSVDRRLHPTVSHTSSNPRTSAPDFLANSFSGAPSITSEPSAPTSPVVMEKENMLDSVGGFHAPEPTEIKVPQDALHAPDTTSNADTRSITTSQYENMIHDELERIWILNLSMHFRDKSKREKFFVTYRENNTQWRRVTISLDYRNAPENSLEMELVATNFQRDKSAKIYEAIRESLADIQFYDTVTNLKLQTAEGRLHVHVVEDVNETIHYPSVQMVQHMRCRRVREKDLYFESHMSGFVYKVRVNDEILIKKEIPGPDTIDEFLYEINALNRLRTAKNVIQFYGVVVDDQDKYVKGLLISFAERGALIDVIYDHNHSLPWPTRERWARQIVTGLSEIHESGFVQGDFTLSNIVIDDNGDAKIIDINRRGCPVGWEPPEATPLIESNQRISMYIGVKSDLYQLGMVLWALATEEDEPESFGRPLRIGSDVSVPLWYRRIVDICLNEEPRLRIHALHLLSLFPEPEVESLYSPPGLPSISVDDGYSPKEYFVENNPINGAPQVRTVHPQHDWSYLTWDHSYPAANPMTEDSYYYPTRGRSPPSPLPSNHDGYDPRYGRAKPAWSDRYNDALTAPTVSDDLPEAIDDQETPEAERRSATPRTNKGLASRFGSQSPAAAEHMTNEKDDEGTQIPREELKPNEDAILKGVHATIGSLINELTPEQMSAVEHIIQQAKDANPVAPRGKNSSDVGVKEPGESIDNDAGPEEGVATTIDGTGGDPAEGADDLVPVSAAPGIKAVGSQEDHGTASVVEEGPQIPLDHFPSTVPEDAAMPDICSVVREDVLSSAKGVSPARPPSSGSRDSGTTPTGQPPELTGIGSAYDLTPEQRQNSIQEEDFGVAALNTEAAMLASTTDDHAKE